MQIEYITGDATNPIGNNTRVIVHICNDVGGWGKGFVMAISKKWKQPELEYRKWFKDGTSEPNVNIQFERLESRDDFAAEKNFKLGNVQFVKTTDNIWVANMIAQRDIKPSKDGDPPIRYAFVSEGLERVRLFVKRHDAIVHMPRIGCGLAGGKWPDIEALIQFNLIDHSVKTIVYDF